MKKIYTLFSCVAFSAISFGQAITITAADIPVPSASFDLYRCTGAIPNPTIATSGNWDYSTQTGPNSILNYPPVTDPFFTAAGADVFLSDQKKYFNATMVYFYDVTLDFNATGAHENGIDIKAQPYDISSLTGTSGDSLNIPAQRYIIPTPLTIYRTPMTANSSWYTISRRVTNFSLTLGAAGLDHAPSQHVYYSHRKDTIVGWGKARVYTAAGPSIAYDVLMAKSFEYNIDSFFIGGAPAPAAILSGFGITQGQQNESSYRYRFLRKGSFMYLANFDYGTDNTYSTLNTLFVVQNDVATATGINDIAGNKYTTILFPNPSTGHEVNLMMAGAKLNDGKYCVTDMLGRIIQTGAANLINDALHITFNHNLPAGSYMLTISDNGTQVASESFTVAR
jgi:hypothetical protein